MEIKNRFIESLFFGNIVPKARAVKEGGRADKLRKFITDHNPEFETALQDDRQELLSQILDAQSKLDTITELDCFNEWRNQLLEADYPTEDVDALLLKIIDKAEGK